jgi:hypothetical protein
VTPDTVEVRFCWYFMFTWRKVLLRNLIAEPDRAFPVPSGLPVHGF